MTRCKPRPPRPTSASASTFRPGLEKPPTRNHPVKKTYLYLLGALFCGLTQAQTSGQLAPTNSAARHTIEGRWSWSLPGKSCIETWRYEADGKRSSQSGEEVLQGRYEISKIPSLLGFYQITQTITQSNGKPDCAGDRHAAPSEGSDSASKLYLQLSPKRDQLIACKGESLEACFGPLRRLAD